MIPVLFTDRRHAGRVLAETLREYAHRDDVLVFAIPRGGVPVAHEVARALQAPLDVVVVRKLGMPGHEEYAIGAIASGGVLVLNEEAVNRLAHPDAVIDQVAAVERRELERRERLYRGERAPVEVRGRTVILVDDGLATGSTMLAAVRALRARHPARLVVAVPIGSAETCEALRGEADVVVCPHTPEPFGAVGNWYANFLQTSDSEVAELLDDAGQPRFQENPMRLTTEAERLDAVRAMAWPLTGQADEHDGLLRLIGDAHFVLLGEATHGTHEFYRDRARITRRLIAEKGFDAVAIEGDWPDAWRVNLFVKGGSGDAHAVDALADFQRFPTWMWRNTEVLDFVDWLRAFNDTRAPQARVGFYGMDLYSLRGSMASVLDYLDHADPAAAARARERYACFDRFGHDSQVYGLLAGGGPLSCEAEVIEMLVELRRRAAEAARAGGEAHGDEAVFNAEQNARVVRSAEAYYRTMYLREESSWNLRDRHMAGTLEELGRHLGRRGHRPKIVVWAHNSHLGDARATEMGQRRGELNVGQLMREAHGHDAVLVGFTTHAGSVTAASDWDGAAQRMQILPAREDSHEALMHAAGIERFLLSLRSAGALQRRILDEPRLERAIGVLYRPQTERQSHYFFAQLPRQFDAILHVDTTQALRPLERQGTWQDGEVPETYPSGM